MLSLGLYLTVKKSIFYLLIILMAFSCATYNNLSKTEQSSCDLLETDTIDVIKMIEIIENCGPIGTYPQYPGCSTNRCTEGSILNFFEHNFRQFQFYEGEYGMKRCMLNFTIKRNGEVDSIYVLDEENVDVRYLAEFIRIIKDLPKFKPGLGFNSEYIDSIYKLQDTLKYTFADFKRKYPPRPLSCSYTIPINYGRDYLTDVEYDLMKSIQPIFRSKD